MIRQYLIINCDLAIFRYDFVNKTAAAVGFRIIGFLPYLVCGICLTNICVIFLLIFKTADITGSCYKRYLIIKTLSVLIIDKEVHRSLRRETCKQG